MNVHDKTKLTLYSPSYHDDEYKKKNEKIKTKIKINKNTKKIIMISKQ